MASVLPPVEDAPAFAVTPDSITWQRAGDLRAFFASGTALLLQVAHPTVGAGVAQFSTFKTDPWGRLWRTLDYVNLTVYGGPERAAETGRRMRAMHRQIKGVAADGTRYHALEPEAYAWVHATLAYGIFRSHERFGRRMSRGEQQELWTEWRRLGRLLGIRERDLPAALDGFWHYVDEMVETRLEDNDSVQDVLATLSARDAPPGVPPAAWSVARIPASRIVSLATVDLLPRRLQRKLGLSLSTRQRLELEAVARASRAATPLLPAWMKVSGPGYLKWRERQIARGAFGGPREGRVPLAA